MPVSSRSPRCGRRTQSRSQTPWGYTIQMVDRGGVGEMAARLLCLRRKIISRLHLPPSTVPLRRPSKYGRDSTVWRNSGDAPMMWRRRRWGRLVQSAAQSVCGRGVVKEAALLFVLGQTWVVRYVGTRYCRSRGCSSTPTVRRSVVQPAMSSRYPRALCTIPP